MLDSPHQHHLRYGRHSEEGRIYLVTVVTRDHERLFTDWQAGRCVVRELRAVHEDGLAKSIAWVVMPDHIHWLFELGPLPLSRLLQVFKSKSAISVNRHLHRTGPVWQRHYHDRALRHEDDLKHLARYTIANPLRANLVTCLGDYPLWGARWL